MSEQDIHVSSEKAVQKHQKLREKRSRSAKIGRIKYNQQLLKRCLRGIEDLRTELRWIRHKLDRLGEAEYKVSDVERFAVEDEVDREILQRLFEVGVQGAFPKDVAAALNRRADYGLRYYDVSRRCVRMNKRMQFETGHVLFEKRGHKWALTKFGFDVYAAAEEVGGT